MSNTFTAPTNHLRFVRRLVGEPTPSLPFGEYKFRLQQRIDTTTLVDGQWVVTTKWQDVPVTEETY